ncbi:hypothetical protein BDBG_02070 [Blastomyces gilchristii SLH14081]|uniref:Uncharacterized protein n=1 Tax=Blastomyces gilchristii (strain SLH14081) TaxID=559298 RepID=A0A179UEL1_BLAGS|nr:uncharacterized protein BDBG_02070 [Blastomyces gilchristii SLH14081]OAT05728.1 hypothetical protein BDBG_02070 [Blastomyces gilchristii SLH14081]
MLVFSTVVNGWINLGRRHEHKLAKAVFGGSGKVSEFIWMFLPKSPPPDVRSTDPSSPPALHTALLIGWSPSDDPCQAKFKLNAKKSNLLKLNANLTTSTLIGPNTATATRGSGLSAMLAVGCRGTE